MKHIFIIIFFPLLTTSVYGQNVSINFENQVTQDFIEIDSGSIWQIGSPSKTTFTSAYSSPNVLVTDTLNPYPPNDTSSFIVKYALENYALSNNGGHYTGGIHGWVFIDCDSSDYLQVNFSPDNGNTWVDLVNDTLQIDSIGPNYTVWRYYSSLQLSGMSNGWQYFVLDNSINYPLFNIQNGDTLLYRFTFVSDSVNNSRDGFMFDNMGLYDVWSGVKNIQSASFFSNTFPNPARNSITFKFDNTSQTPHSLQIFDALGRVIYHQSNIQNDQFSVNTADFDAGIYHYELKNEKNDDRSIGRFVVLY